MMDTEISPDDNIIPIEIPFQAVLDALLVEEEPINERYLYRLSDLEGEELRKLNEVWSAIPRKRRQTLMENLGTLAQNDYLLSFENISRVAILDEDPATRIAAIQTLIACESEALDLLSIYTDYLEGDNDPDVRAISAVALAPFVYLCEMELLSARLQRDLEDRLINAYLNDSDKEVRQRALESLGFSGRDEVNGLIEAAYHQTDSSWVASALIAMGRSANTTWEQNILSKLNHTNPRIRLEATRATGELSLIKGRPQLFELVQDSNEDVRLAALWSLSQMGGTGVRQLLVRHLDAAVDEKEIQFIEQALDNLEFNEGLQTFGLMDIDEADLEDVADLWDESDLEDDLFFTDEIDYDDEYNEDLDEDNGD